MCFKYVQGKWVPSKGAALLFAVTLLTGAVFAICGQIKKVGVFAHEEYFIPAIESRSSKVFIKMHEPYEKKLEKLCKTQEIMLEMFIRRDGLDVYNEAKKTVELREESRTVK